MGFRENLRGNKFNKLTVVDFAYNKNGRAYWKCQCNCGNITYVSISHLKSGHTKSCGCLGEYNRKKLYKYIVKHQMMNTKLYIAWNNMKARCYNPNNKAYKNYRWKRDNSL